MSTDFTVWGLETWPGLANEPLGARESESTAQIRSRNDLAALMVKLHMPSVLCRGIFMRLGGAWTGMRAKCPCTGR